MKKFLVEDLAMTITQKAVEAALDAADYIPNPDNRKWMRAAIEAAIAVDGVALVPKEPTEAMIIAGCENNPTQWNEGTDLGFAADVANDVYRAMLDAASDREERR